MALTLDGGIKCWGNNELGQLGDGTTVHRRVPVDVIGLTSGVVAISTGDLFTCALTASGGVKCWGDNTWGQLGDGATTRRLTPVDVIGLNSGIVAISAGNPHTCALTSKGGVKCWGVIGTRGSLLTPVDINGLAGGARPRRRRISHLCADFGWRGQVLGI